MYVLLTYCNNFKSLSTISLFRERVQRRKYELKWHGLCHVIHHALKRTGMNYYLQLISFVFTTLRCHKLCTGRSGWCNSDISSHNIGNLKYYDNYHCALMAILECRIFIRCKFDHWTILEVSEVIKLGTIVVVERIVFVSIILSYCAVFYLYYGEMRL